MNTFYDDSINNSIDLNGTFPAWHKTSWIDDFVINIQWINALWWAWQLLLYKSTWNLILTKPFLNNSRLHPVKSSHIIFLRLLPRHHLSIHQLKLNSQHLVTRLWWNKTVQQRHSHWQVIVNSWTSNISLTRRVEHQEASEAEEIFNDKANVESSAITFVLPAAALAPVDCGELIAKIATIGNTLISEPPTTRVWSDCHCLKCTLKWSVLYSFVKCLSSCSSCSS